MKRCGADYVTFVMQKIDDAKITGFANSVAFVHNRTQRLRYRWTGVKKVYVNAAWTIMARSHGLRDAAIFARPTYTPTVHGADAIGPFLTQ
jgi:hypothetical protein